MTKTNELLRRSILIKLLILCLIVVTTACGDDDGEDPATPPVTEDPTEEPDDDFIKYIGEWNGNLGFTGVPISAKVEEISEGRFEGDFFITTTFSSCCGSGDSDGKISYEVDGTTLTNFKWIDVIPGCTGTFTGSGIVRNNGDLEIDITGTDCDGNHVVTLSLELQN